MAISAVAESGDNIVTSSYLCVYTLFTTLNRVLMILLTDGALAFVRFLQVLTLD